MATFLEKLLKSNFACAHDVGMLFKSLSVEYFCLQTPAKALVSMHGTGLCGVVQGLHNCYCLGRLWAGVNQ